MKLYDVQSKQLLHSFQDHSSLVNSVAFSSDGRYLASASVDNTVKLYDVQSKQLLHSFQDHSSLVNSVAFSSDGRYLASASVDNTVKLYDVQSKQLLHSFQDHSLRVYSVAFSSDGRYLASASEDKTVKLYDIRKFILAHEVGLGEITYSFPLLMEQVNKHYLLEDNLRADLDPYNAKILTDTNLGHWSLWDAMPTSETVKVVLKEPLVARNPQSSVVDGLVGIDFGTKSTVVVYQKETVDIFPMRVGTGRLSQKVSRKDYENPTVMECINLTDFMANYQASEGRPLTCWGDLTISHTAANSMINSASSHFNTFVNELKQWAGDKNRKLKLLDRQNTVFDLPAFLDLAEDDLNPIELYAYYLGLYINNQNNGIFLNYTLSFPVTYEKAVREKILQSFKQGLKKSLPLALHHQIDLDNNLKVYAGTSEPAAYAAVALKSYQFDPSEDEKIFYGVFDFGGGTTDFDFGIYREANGPKERRYDYVIEHFGAGGDRFLGGENLLEMLSFEVFKVNTDALLENQVQFTLPPEGTPFVGSEPLLAQTREAKMNTKTMMEALRPFWENEESHGLDEGTVTLNLFNKEGQLLTNIELTITESYLEKILKDRIQMGVESFFHGLRKAFSHQSLDLSSIKQVHIFLAGNSSKSRYLKPLFEDEIEKVEVDIKKDANMEAQDIFKIYPPLDGEALDKPNGKTGVAFGLIETRKGGGILIKDHNTKFADDIRFKFYLGDSRKNKFKIVISRDTPYNQWVEFIDAFEDTFEIFYSSSERVSSNQIPIKDASIKKKLFTLELTDDNAFVYIRLIDSTTIEYVVANEEGIKNNCFLIDPVRVELK